MELLAKVVTLVVLFSHEVLCSGFIVLSTNTQHNITISLEALQHGTHNNVSNKVQTHHIKQTASENIKSEQLKTDQDAVTSSSDVTSVPPSQTDTIKDALVNTISDVSKHPRHSPKGDGNKTIHKRQNNSKLLQKLLRGISTPKQASASDSQWQSNDATPVDVTPGQMVSNKRPATAPHDRIDTTTPTPSSNLQQIIRGILFPVLYPTVTVVVVQASSDKGNYATRVPLGTSMTVLDALIAATRDFIRKHSRLTDIPYNVQLNWNRGLKCFAINKALGIGSRRRAGWVITVVGRKRQIVYRGRCVPEYLHLQAGDAVHISYERIRRSWRGKA